MKALFYNFAAKKFVLKNIAVPSTKTDEALVKVKASALCGTDLHIMDGSLTDKSYNKKEIILGHSFSGVIENIGGQSRFKIGDRVFISNFVWCGKCSACKSKNENLCDHRYVFGMEAPGSHSQYIKVPQKSLFHLPSNFSFEEGSLICDLLAIVCHSIRKAAPSVGQKIIIFGAGPIGIALGIILNIYGHKSVFITDPVDYRRNLAKKFNLKTIDNKELSREENKFDIVFDTSGDAKALQLGYKLLKRGGKMVMVGVQSEDFKFKSIKWISRELTLFGIFNFDTKDIKESLRLIKSKKINLKKLITHRFALSEGNKAYELLRNKKAGKIILIP